MPDILVERHDHVTVITLNRPATLNTFTSSMTSELAAVMEGFNSDPEQYVAVVTGAGDRAFSSGFDLNKMSSRVAAGDASIGNLVGRSLGSRQQS